MALTGAWRLVRIVSILVVLAAIVVQAKTLTDAGLFDPTRFFAFFTIQSNLIGVAALGAAMWVKQPRARSVELLRGAAAAYLTVTFLVVIVLLSGVDVQLQLVWVDIVLHKLFPIVVVADWLLDPPHVRLALRDAAVWLVYPIVWIVLTLIRGGVDAAHWYPYPFLDPANGGYAQVVVTVIGVTIGFLVIAAVYVWLANWRRGDGAAPELRPA
jgi:hypothetical protein